MNRKSLNLNDFDFTLPASSVAQTPPLHRGSSRLMLVNRLNPDLATHLPFSALPDLLDYPDLLVFNDSKVFRARLFAEKRFGGTRFEILLLTENGPNDWWGLGRPGKRLRTGDELRFLPNDPGSPSSSLHAVVAERNVRGQFRLIFSGSANVRGQLLNYGHVPLPPYIHRPDSNLAALDAERYQTVYAREEGSVAAPTAGLHFSEELLEGLRQKKIQMAFVTLHVGPGTFSPVKTADIAEHRMHAEAYELSQTTADAVEKARDKQGRICAVGTTSLRVLETVALKRGGDGLAAASGQTQLFLHPPATFQVVDALLTNFHLPKSTLLMLVAAFLTPGETRGVQCVRKLYHEALETGYRFYSYGDAMLIV